MEQKAYTNDLFLILFFGHWEDAVQNYMQHYSLGGFEQNSTYINVKQRLL